MKQEGLQGALKNRALLILVCVVGTALILYGMAKDDNLIFVIGILLVIGGYLLVRRRIKKHIGKGP